MRDESGMLRCFVVRVHPISIRCVEGTQVTDSSEARAEAWLRERDRNRGLLLTALACEVGHGFITITNRALYAHGKPAFEIARNEGQNTTTLMATCGHHPKPESAPTETAKAEDSSPHALNCSTRGNLGVCDCGWVDQGQRARAARETGKGEQVQSQSYLKRVEAMKREK